MRSALEIANWFIENRRDREVDQLKIQKLLYIAFGVHLVTYNEELFYDPIEAWKYGPVVSSVYNNLMHYSRNPIAEPISLLDKYVPRIDEKDPKAMNAISSMVATFDEFGYVSAPNLVNWTHNPGGPWETTYNESGQKGISLISRERIRRAFTVDPRRDIKRTIRVVRESSEL